MGIRLATVMALLLAALAATACESPYGTANQSASSSGATTSRPATQSAVASQSPAAASVLSAKSLEYSMRLGGTSHQGETVNLIIGATASTEAEAQAVLAAAMPKFGDMQSYFIVQHSNKFEGLVPGQWIVIEAHRGTPTSKDMQFAKRGFPSAYVKKAVVRTGEPIPVFEDMVDE